MTVYSIDLLLAAALALELAVGLLAGIIIGRRTADGD